MYKSWYRETAQAGKLEVIKSAVAYMNAGGAIPSLGGTFTVSGGFPIPTTSSHKNDWINVDNAAKKVISVDMERYLAFVATKATLKPAPAFDQTGLAVTGGAGEANLFGTKVNLINPMRYLGTNAGTAPYCYVRNGTRATTTCPRRWRGSPRC